MSQLNLFHEYEMSLQNEDLSKAANDILEALNDGMKEKYEPHYYFQESNVIVLTAVNKHKDVVFNVLNMEGKTPEGMSACWRGFGHIKIDLQNLIEEKQ